TAATRPESAARPGSRSTRARLVATLTLAARTPGTAARAFSTRDAQDAQVMPRIGSVTTAAAGGDPPAAAASCGGAAAVAATPGGCGLSIERYRAGTGKRKNRAGRRFDR